MNRKLNAFTLSELMITLALTSIMIGFLYTSYNYTQKTLIQFNKQNAFLTEYTELEKRLKLLSAHSSGVFKESENKIRINSDTSICTLEFTPLAVLINKKGITDTFNLKPQSVKYSFEKFNNPAIENVLINTVEFDISFDNETFHIVFRKEYDAYIRFLTETNTLQN